MFSNPTFAFVCLIVDCKKKISEEFCWEEIFLENDYEDDNIEEENVDDDKNVDECKLG